MFPSLEAGINRFGPRGVILIVLGVLWAGIGVGVLLNPWKPNDGELVLHELLPDALRVALWVGTGAVAAIYGMRSPTHDDTRGHVALVIMPLERTLSFAASWLLWWVTTALSSLVETIEPVGYPQGWYAALIWSVILVMLRVIAGWRDPVRAALPSPQGRA